jgi:hypothetical protein
VKDSSLSNHEDEEEKVDQKLANPPLKRSDSKFNFQRAADTDEKD